ncbi:N-hydroxyarylamine O-acetyltransferase [Prauserella shujinwangii]|uniref:N-hydroxyarylamine O-acetyltransferase n=1 Tax=Prauserella shujinwangii TaxID=1453103 RepID=A0A2T0LVY3_9PSEU|nr:arylamine N-acetyltransferase [Prauserella shujinwangii]PRX47939.1 N-hydroxyarylamine O-acetyltransferase [Prauserella shujinwangii]
MTTAAVREPAPETDDWGIDAVDVDAYLRRIGHPRVEPSAEALRSLHEAHVRTIPFENVDVLLGDHPGIGTDALMRKLVHRRRGGYCFEHASLFAAVLERLGFTVQRRMARVQPHRSGPQTHMMLAVHADGEDYLADVGFGSGILRPMPLRDGATADQGGWEHRIARTADGWMLTKRTAEGWEPQHTSDESSRRPIDYQVAHHYTSTHPDSPFFGRLVVIRLTPGTLRRLVDRELHIEHSDGSTERIPVPPERLGETLRDLDVDLTADELDRLLAALAERERQRDQNR